MTVGSAVTKRLRLPAAKAIEPFGQGDLDGLCGLYAAVNALRLVVAGRGEPLSEDHIMTLFRHGASFLEQHSKLSAAVRYGTRWRLWIKLVEELAAKAGRLLRTTITLDRPFPRTDDLSHAEFIAAVGAALAEGRAVLIFFKCDEDHFSVVSGISRKRLRLFDSYGYTSLRFEDCATSGPIEKRPYRIHIPSMLVIGP